jgi:hypothetical protein
MAKNFQIIKQSGIMIDLDKKKKYYILLYFTIETNQEIIKIF